MLFALFVCVFACLFVFFCLLVSLGLGRLFVRPSCFFACLLVCVIFTPPEVSDADLTEKFQDGDGKKFVCLVVCLFVCLFVFVFVCLSIASLFVCLCLFVCLLEVSGRK